MFGFVKAYKPELRVKEFDFYKAVYCSLCRDLGKKYGIVARFSLSYDFTFLSLLHMSLTDGCTAIERKRCVCNPLKKCNYLCSGGLPEMPTAAAAIMLYSKLNDNIADEGFFKGLGYRLLRLLSRKGYKKAVADFPKIGEVFTEYLKAQNKVEENNTSDVDIAAEPTAKMLSELFQLCAPNGETRALERLGYSMGRWIYILDAAVDLQKDIKKNRYNPFKAEVNDNTNLTEFFQNRIIPSLNICISESEAAFDLLDIKKLKNILGNIIYIGLEESQKTELSIIKEKSK